MNTPCTLLGITFRPTGGISDADNVARSFYNSSVAARRRDSRLNSKKGWIYFEIRLAKL